MVTYRSSSVLDSPVVARERVAEHLLDLSQLGSSGARLFEFVLLHLFKLYLVNGKERASPQASPDVRAQPS